MFSFATSGNFHFWLGCLVFNLDCMYRHCKMKIYPNRNLIRVSISALLYLLPLIVRRLYGIFLTATLVLCLSAWLFSAYPLKGYSHSAFHIVIGFIPPLLISAARQLRVSQVLIRSAQECAALHDL